MESLYKTSNELFKLAEIKNNIIDKCIENEGEISNEDLQSLLKSESESLTLGEKLVNFKKFLETNEEYISNEKKRLIELSKQNTNKLEFIDKLLMQILLLYGNENPKNNVKTLNFKTDKISTRKSESVDIVGTVNPNYCTYSITVDGLNHSDKVRLESIIKVEGYFVKVDEKVDKKEIKPKLLEDEAKIYDLNQLSFTNQINEEEYKKEIEKLNSGLIINRKLNLKLN